MLQLYMKLKLMKTKSSSLDKQQTQNGSLVTLSLRVLVLLLCGNPDYESNNNAHYNEDHEEYTDLLTVGSLRVVISNVSGEL